MRLCEHLGWPHPDYLLLYLSAEQFTDWMEYEAETGPLGHARDDAHFGIMASVFNNRMRGKSEAAQKPEIFMPYYNPPPETEEELHLRIKHALGR